MTFEYDGHPSREGGSRAVEERPEFIYRPQNHMALPNMGPNLHFRWARAKQPGGAWDDTNMAGYFAERWRTVSPGELPDDFVAQGGEYRGETVVMRGDMILMVTTSAFAKARNAYYQNEARRSVADSDKMQGLNARDEGKLPTVSEDRGSRVEYGIRRT